MTEENITANEGTEATGVGVPDILQNLGSEQAALLTSYQDHLSSLAEQRKLPEGEYLEDVPEDIRARKLLDTKIKDANDRRSQVKEQYEQATKAAHEKLEQRKEALREELFDVDPNTLMQATLAPDEKLQELANAATRAGTSGLSLAKVVLAVCNERGLDEVAVPLLQTFPTLEQSWREWQMLPSDEVLERQTDPARVEGVVPEVSRDRLQVRPRASAY